MEVWNNIALPDVPMPIAAPAAVQPTPLLISGLVDNSNTTEFDHTVDEAGMCAQVTLRRMLPASADQLARAELSTWLV